MNSDKSSSHKSNTSCVPCNTHGNSNSTKNGLFRCSHSLQDSEGADDRTKINLHEFLDFLNVSCHVNELIAQSDHERVVGKSTPSNASKDKSTVNFKKLAENRLVNDLYGHKENAAVAHADESLVDQYAHIVHPAVGNGNGGRLHRRRSSCGNNSLTGSTTNIAGVGSTWQPWKRTESIRSSNAPGLHPKLSEQLDFVISEGVLDSVLPFICPVPANAVVRGKNKPKEVQIKKEGVAAEADTGLASSEVEKEATQAAGDTAASIVKFREPRSLSRTNRSSSNQRFSNASSGGIGADDKREPEVIIHVCDEVKNTSRDFSCPQNLLVSKMGYFADVTAGQKLDDMDISVHCDIHIFDWLMRWVKHTANGLELQHGAGAATNAALDTGPQLDASNVVPILVSASFLQMEPLFADCLSFCHARLSEVVRVSTNLSCLNDSIMTRLAAMFTNSELETVRDKKERVTPRLWTKLIQSLCEAEPEALRGHYYSLAGLFRCSKCEKCLTNTVKSYISCLPSNVRLNRWGQLVSHHVRDSTWDINTFITQLFKEQKSWRKVYWKLWGHCHFLYCCACESHFPVYQMAWCRYHPEGPNFLGPVTEGRIAGPTGRYPCCGQQAFRFETMPGPNGCQFREHSVLVGTDRERAILGIVQLVSEGHALCEPPPMKLQEAVNNGSDAEPRWMGLSLMPQRCRQGLLPVLNPDESAARIARRARRGASTYFVDSSSETDTTDTLEDAPNPARRRYLERPSCPSFSTSSDGCESDFSDVKAVHSKKGGRKRPTDTPGRHWSGELSARSNQDHQREFEEKVMKQVVAIVTKKIGSEHSATQNSAPLGGTYVRLEAEWKDHLKQRGSTFNQGVNANGANPHAPTLPSSVAANSLGPLNTKQKNK